MKHIKTRFLLIPAIFALSACSMMPSALKRGKENDVVVPEAIEIVDLNNVAMLTTDVLDNQTGEILYDYYFTFKKADSNPALYLKAVVTPKKCAYPDTRVIKDEQISSFEIITHEEDSSLENNVFIVKPTSPLDQGELLSAPFFVETTNPGITIKSRVCVAFYRNAYN